MSVTTLEDVATAVVRRAQRQGFISPEEIREELGQGSIDAAQWKEVVSLSGSALRFRQGKYYYKPAVSPSLQTEQRHRRQVQNTIRQLIREYKRSRGKDERRRQERADFIQQVKVQFEPGRELTLLSRDLSPDGIRLIGTTSLLGQKVVVHVPCPESKETLKLVLRVLWTCTVGDGLYENGGCFLEIAESLPEAEPSLV